jgi:hypothetical protein
MSKMKALIVKDSGRAWVLLALLAGLSSPAAADSIFSVNGFGETIIAVDARGMAMGAAGLANPSPWHISLENPASLAHVGRFSFGASLVPEMRRIELDSGDESASFAYVPFLRFTHGLPGELAGAAAIGMLQRVSYRTEERRTQDGVQIIDVRSGSGGPGFVSVALARKIGKRAALGAELRVLVGTIEDERNVRFIGEPALESKDIVKTSFGGEPLGRFGAYFDVTSGLGIGGTFQFSRVMDVKTTVNTREETLSRIESTVTYPSMGGLGAKLDLGENAVLTGEWFRTWWSDTGKLAGYEGEMADADRLSFGIEWRKGDRRLPLRAGYLWRELPYLQSGNSEAATEFAFTAGFGLPFPNENGSFDVAIQIGKRGDLDSDGAEERFLRFTLSAVGTEFLGHVVPGSE